MSKMVEYCKYIVHAVTHVCIRIYRRIPMFEYICIHIHIQLDSYTDVYSNIAHILRNHMHTCIPINSAMAFDPVRLE